MHFIIEVYIEVYIEIYIETYIEVNVIVFIGIPYFIFIIDFSLIFLQGVLHEIHSSRNPLQ